MFHPDTRDVTYRVLYGRLVRWVPYRTRSVEQLRNVQYIWIHLATQYSTTNEDISLENDSGGADLLITPSTLKSWYRYGSKGSWIEWDGQIDRLWVIDMQWMRNFNENNEDAMEFYLNPEESTLRRQS